MLKQIFGQALRHVIARLRPNQSCKRPWLNQTTPVEGRVRTIPRAPPASAPAPNPTPHGQGSRNSGLTQLAQLKQQGRPTLNTLEKLA